MWVGDRTVGTLQALYNTCTSTSCSGYQDWKGRVAAQLPGVSEANGTLPSVDVDPNGIVAISIFWRAPSEPTTSDAHRFDIQTQIQQ